MSIDNSRKWPPAAPGDLSVMIAERQFRHHVLSMLLKQARSTFAQKLAHVVTNPDSAPIDVAVMEDGQTFIEMSVQGPLRKNIEDLFRVNTVHAYTIEDDIIVDAINSYDTTTKEGRLDIQILADHWMSTFYGNYEIEDLVRDLANPTGRRPKTPEGRRELKQKLGHLVEIVPQNLMALHRQILDQSVPFTRPETD